MTAEAPVQPAPALLKSSVAVTHDWVTFQVPTMLPPHGEIETQLAPLPPVPPA
jgi:hypothetical protein